MSCTVHNYVSFNSFLELKLANQFIKGFNCYKTFLKSIVVGIKFLNQARTGLQPASAWFIEMQLCMCVCLSECVCLKVCVCVCVSTPKAINN